MTYVTYLFGFPDGSISPAHGDGLAAVSRPGHLGRAGAGRHRALAVAPHDRQGRAHAAAIRHGLPAHHLAVRHFRHRPGADRLAGMAARLGVQLSGDPARHHRDRRAALSAVRKVLPHFPAAGATGRQALPGGRRATTRALTARAAASGSPRACTSTICAPCCRKSASITPCPGPAGHWQELCPACKRKTLSIARK